ncbi:MAG: Ku protein, partial [Janthinobacterium lividum]
DFAPIGYQRINKDTGKQVEWDDIVKGYEYEEGEYVVLSPEDLRQANVKATQTIDIISFADRAEVPIIHYEQPYYLAPDKGGNKVYALLRETLVRSGMIGIAQVVIRTKQHLVALLPVDDMIVLNTLRYPDEIRAPELELPGSSLKQAGISEKEVKMALELVRGMTSSWDPGEYHDTYREDVLALVKKKIKARQTKTITEAAPEEKPAKGAKIIDLMALLRQSVGAKAGGKTSAAAANDGDDDTDADTDSREEDKGHGKAGTARKPAAGLKPAKPAKPAGLARPAAKKAASKTTAASSKPAEKTKTGKLRARA